MAVIVDIANTVFTYLGGSTDASVTYTGIDPIDINTPTHSSWISVNVISSAQSSTTTVVRYQIGVNSNDTGDYRLGNITFSAYGGGQNITIIRQGTSNIASYSLYDNVYQTVRTSTIGTSQFNYQIKYYKPKYGMIWDSSTMSYHYGIIDYDIITTFTGRAVAAPGSSAVTINISDNVRDYIHQSMETIPDNPNNKQWYELSSSTVQNDYAYGEFVLCDEFGVELYAYNFLYQYEDGWNSFKGDYTMSEPINKHIDPRMKLMHTKFYMEGLFSVSPNSLTFDSSGGSQTITVWDSNVEWLAFSEDSWLSISPNSGSTAATNISVTASDNATASARTGNVIIRGGSTTVDIPVTQPRMDMTLSVSETEFELGIHSGSTSFTVTSNYGFEISGATVEGITLSPLSGGSGTTTVTITYGENRTSDRSGTYTVYNLDNHIDVDVTQAGPMDTSEYLTFNIESDGTIAWDNNTGSSGYTYLVYSKNQDAWVTASTSSHTINVVTGDKVSLKGYINPYYNTSSKHLAFTASTASYSLSGNIMSIQDDSDSYDFTTANTIYYDNEFAFMFMDCTGLTSVSDLVMPATTLKNGCYYRMFDGCTALTDTPSVLPATTLAVECYVGMFRHCPITAITADFLPATTLANNCYNDMFGFTNISSLPSGLLPATTLNYGCYAGMFRYCPITSIPNNFLPATTLASNCYSEMFASCTALTSVPATLLPVTTLTDYCYRSMFSYCSNITNAPELPATTMADGCYASMFLGCTSLTTAPDLPATALTYACYDRMFSSCNALNYVKCLAVTYGNYDTTYWLNNVSPTGTFVKDSQATWATGTSGIPSGWTIVNA